MRIAVLGWGSLTWDPRNLQISEQWHVDGPVLPSEFARISNKRRLTLVLYPGAESVQTLWAISAHEELNQARENLREREKTTLKNIGYVSLPDNENNCQAVPEACYVIRQWAGEKGFDAAIWTDLTSNFKDKTGMALSEDNVIAYLRSLTGESLEKAEEYVRRAPAQVTTRIRSRIEREIGWV
jgi:hypothetical protein